MALVLAACGDDTAVTATGGPTTTAATTTTNAGPTTFLTTTTTSATSTSGATTSTSGAATTTTTAVTTTTTAGTTTIAATTTTSPASTTTAAPATVVVDISGSAFHPANVAVATGTTVTWRNSDGFNHTTTSDSGVWGAGLAGGASFSFTFTTPGAYSYHCNIHPFMTGTVTVTG